VSKCKILLFITSNIKLSCMIMKKKVKKISREYKIACSILNVRKDSNASILAMQYSVVFTPTLVLLKDNKPVERVAGDVSLQSIINLLKNFNCIKAKGGVYDCNSYGESKTEAE